LVFPSLMPAAFSPDESIMRKCAARFLMQIKRAGAEMNLLD